jgi:hypothetical protein
MGRVMTCCNCGTKFFQCEGEKIEVICIKCRIEKEELIKLMKKQRGDD